MNDKKRCLITGASSGIGQVIKSELETVGYTISSMQRTKSDVFADFSDPGTVANAFDRYSMISNFPPELVVLNAGEGRSGRYIDFTEKDIIEHINLNLVSPLLLARMILEHWCKCSMRGHLVFIGSQVALPGGVQPDNALYTAGKGGIHGCVPALALEYGPEIRVNGIAPGDVHTPLAEKAIEYASLKDGCATEEVYEKTRRAAVLKKWVNPKDIGRAVVFLEESSSITGTILNISCGRTL